MSKGSELVIDDELFRNQNFEQQSICDVMILLFPKFSMTTGKMVAKSWVEAD